MLNTVQELSAVLQTPDKIELLENAICFSRTSNGPHCKCPRDHRSIAMYLRFLPDSINNPGMAARFQSLHHFRVGLPNDNWPSPT